MDITESQYKFNLSLNLIYFLMNVLLYTEPNKIECISEIIDKWNSSINNTSKIVHAQKAKQYATEYNVEEDVASVLISAHQVEYGILRKEFVDQIKKILINTYIQEQKENL